MTDSPKQKKQSLTQPLLESSFPGYGDRARVHPVHSPQLSWDSSQDLVHHDLNTVREEEDGDDSESSMSMAHSSFGSGPASPSRPQRSKLPEHDSLRNLHKKAPPMFQALSEHKREPRDIARRSISQAKWEKVSNLLSKVAAKKRVAPNPSDVYKKTWTGVPWQESEITDQQLETSVMYMTDGIHARLIGYSLERHRVAFYKQFHARWWRMVYTFAATLHILFAFFERPSTFKQSAYDLRVDRIIGSFEFLCVSVYIYDLYLFIGCFGWTKLAKHRWTIGRLLIICLIFFDLLVSFSTNFSDFRFSRCLRPLLIVFRLRNIRRVFGGWIGAVPRVSIILIISFFLICIYGFAGFLFFWHLDTAKFQHLNQAIYTMLLIQTSLSTLLSAMKPCYEDSSFSAIFFVSFIVVGNLFLLKLLIAVSHRSYTQYTHTQAVRALRKRKIAITAAFRQVATYSQLSEDTWVRLMKKFRPEVSEEVSRQLFQSVDVDGYGTITLEQFFDLCALSQFEIPHTPYRFSAPRIESIRKLLRKMFNQVSTVFGISFHPVELMVDTLVLLSGLQMFMTAEHNPNIDWIRFGVVLLTMFTLEMCARLFAFGLSRYWKDRVHRLDLLCNLGGIAFYIAVGVSSNSQEAHPAWSAFVKVLRLLRFFKFLKLTHGSKVILRTIDEVTGVISYLLFVYVVLLYVYSVIGMEAFGTTLLPDNVDDRSLTWLTYNQQLGFRSFAASMLTLFQLSVVSSWPLVMDAATEVTSQGAKLYFFSFRIIIVMIYLPIFVGVVIQTFTRRVKKVRFEMEREDTLKAEKRKQFEEREAAAEDADGAVPTYDSEDDGHETPRMHRGRLPLGDETLSSPGHHSRDLSMIFAGDKAADGQYQPTYSVSTALQREKFEKLESEKAELATKMQWQERRLITMANQIAQLQQQLANARAAV